MITIYIRVYRDLYITIGNDYMFWSIQLQQKLRHQHLMFMQILKKMNRVLAALVTISTQIIHIHNIWMFSQSFNLDLFSWCKVTLTASASLYYDARARYHSPFEVLPSFPLAFVRTLLPTSSTISFLGGRVDYCHISCLPALLDMQKESASLKWLWLHSAHT